jgi:hypothetical protein
MPDPVVEGAAAAVTPVVDPPISATSSPAAAAAAPDPKAEPAKTPEAKPDAAEAAKTPIGEAKAPLEYKFTAPEGVKLDEARIGKFTEMAKTANLDPKVAQEMLDLYIADMQGSTAANAQAWTDLQAQWKAELEKDPTFAGPAGADAMVTIGRAFDTYGSKEARDAFNLTGAGNNPAIARFIHSMAKALDEGGAVPAGGIPGKAKSLGERFYGETK